MGVAGTLALGINSASDGPVHTQAMSDEAVPGEASAAAEDLSLSGEHEDLIPTAMATKSAAEPKLIDDRADQVRSSRSAGESRDAVQSKPVTASKSTANYGHEQTQQPTEVAPPSSGSSGSSSATPTPEPSTTPSGGGGGQQGGGLVGGVVGGVGGLVGGLLGG